jgi:hypothetical protein
MAAARHAIRAVERFTYWALGEADESGPDQQAARDMMRLAVGLRRLLDRFPPSRPGDQATRAGLED